MKKAVHGNQPVFNLPKKPLLFVLSGPSGVGKDAVLTRMKKTGFPLHYVVTLTTRPKRARETDKIDYHFISNESFEELINSNGLLEWAEVYGNRYGVPREDVKQALERGEDVMIKVDIQGAASIKKVIPQAVTIFLTPPSMEDLARRLGQRRTESPEAFALRLKTAEEEMKQANRFDYLVVNRWDKIGQAVEEIEAIVASEKNRGINWEIRL